MVTKGCKKLRCGSLEYDIDEDRKIIKLKSDKPASGKGGGASFSDEEVSFDSINSVLKEVNNNIRNSVSLQPCFIEESSSNNCTMLAAALIDMGIIDKKYNVLKLL